MTTEGPSRPRPRDQLVTSDAVVLDVVPASVGSRLASLLIDAIVLGTVLVVLLIADAIVQGSGLFGSPTAAAITALLLYFSLLWGYPILLETLWRGRTVGKAAMGLRVVTVEGAPITFRHALIRAALGLIDYHLLTPVVAFVAEFATSRQQRLGDLAAGTVVVRERTGARRPEALAFTVPPGLEGYAATLDVSSLRPVDYAAARHLLLRAPALPHGVRRQVAEQVAGPIAARMAHSPPRQISAEAFLACVVARLQGGVQHGTVAPPAPAPSPRGLEAPPPVPPGGFAPPT